MEVEIFDLYDADGNKTGKTVRRGDSHDRSLYHMIVSAMVTNDRGEILISRRHPAKVGGGMLEIMAGAAVTGETSIEAVIRELGEELGINASADEFIFIRRVHMDTERPHFFDVWQTIKDVEAETLSLQAEEVTEAFWMPIDEVKGLIRREELFNSHIYRFLLEG